MPPGLFGSTTIDCSACTEKANTRGTTGATGVVVALESVSENGCQYHCWAAASPHVTKLRNHCLRQPTTLASIWELDRAVGTCHQRGGLSCRKVFPTPFRWKRAILAGRNRCEISRVSSSPKSI